MVLSYYIRIMCLCFVFLGTPQDDAGGSDGEEGAVGDDATLTGCELDVVDEGASVAVVVFQRIFEPALLVAADGDGAVVQVDTGVYGLEWCADRVALLVAADDVVAHAEGDDLLVVEHVLDDDDGAAAFGVCLFIGLLVLLTVAQLAHAHADGELLAAVGALEHKRLAVGVTGLVEGDEVLTFWTADAFHTQINPLIITFS